MIRYLKTVSVLLKMNFGKDMIYRWNAVFSLFSASLFVSTFALSSYYVFMKVGEIGGLTFKEYFVLILLGQLWWFTYVLLARKNFQFLMEMIHNGGLDFFLLKPLKLPKILPFIQFDFRHVVPIICAAVLILMKIGIREIGVLRLAGAALFFLNGVWIHYSINSIFVSMSFWLGRNNAIFDLTYELPELVKLPVAFFPSLLQGIFTFAVPVIVVLNPTIQFIFGGIDLSLLASAVIVSVLLFLASEIMWRIGLKKYTSAN